jgi:uncharacterized phage infection (PIP) family protein YhgE
MNNTNTLRTELSALTQRAQTLQTDARDARKHLNAAREAVVEGTGTTSDLMRAQSESDALNGAVEAISQRIAAKSREIDAAEAGESRAAQLKELENGAREFDAARTEARKIGAQIAEALESLPALYANLRRCELLRMSLTGTAQSLDLAADFEGFRDLEKAPEIALENEFLNAMPISHREAARQMLAKERERFFALEKESWRPADGGAAASNSPGLLPSGPYIPHSHAV